MRTGAPVHRLADALGDGLGAGMAGVRQDGDELLPAESHQEIARAQAVAGALRELAQNLVTAIMAVGVVDRLEAVDVHHDQRERARSSRRHP